MSVRRGEEQKRNLSHAGDGGDGDGGGRSVRDFNTLLDGDVDALGADVPFGAHILAKWAGVQRGDEAY